MTPPPSVPWSAGLQSEEDGNYDRSEEVDDRPPMLFELSYMPQSGRDDDVFGAGFFYYPDEAGWGGGLQLHGTIRTIDPEVEVLLNPPASELEGRTRAWAIDAVVARRLTQRLGIFAGAGVAEFEDFRRFTDLVGTSFFISTGRDVKLNGTVGFHLWLTDAFTVSAQYDTAFDSATFGVGYQF